MVAATETKTNGTNGTNGHSNGRQKMLIDVLEEMLDVDVDDMDPKIVNSLPFKAHDMTSNNLIVDIRMNAPECAEIFDTAVKEYGHLGWSKVRDRLSAQFCAENIPNLRGRVLVQVSPSFAYSTQAVLEHARSYDEEFQKVGISRDRYCIKIPTTGPAMCAAKILNAEGIRTLGTALFSLPQALAASQAGCLYISPYFNEVRAHADPRLWPDSDDPATKHTMSARMVHIIEAYRKLEAETGKPQPWIKSASFITAKEAIANAEMGCQGATPLAHVLKELCETPADASYKSSYKPNPYLYSQTTEGATPTKLAKLSATDPLAAADWDGKLADPKTDYLANNGAELEKANYADPITKTRLRDALELFIGAEMKSRDKIEAATAKLGIQVGGKQK